MMWIIAALLVPHFLLTLDQVLGKLLNLWRAFRR